MPTYTSELTFTDYAEMTEHFTVGEYFTMPVKGARTLASHGRDDNGRKMVTFARQHLGNPLRYTFTERS